MLSEQRLYDASPWFLRRLLVNIEARRRDWFRRHGDYASEVKCYDPEWYSMPSAAQEAYQCEQLNTLIQGARTCVPYYRATIPDVQIKSLWDLQSLPLLEKRAVREASMRFVADDLPARDLWRNTTSGSTGTPLAYYHDRSITRAHQAVADALLESRGCLFGERRVRISGAYVVPYEQKRPPFWVFIDRYRQLQCSAYHLGPDSYRYYLAAMRKARVAYGTGYASAWHLLASHVLESGDDPPALRAIFTDSEGITLDQQAAVERAFKCPVLQTYGLGEVGQVAMQCQEKRYHVLTRSCIAEVLNETGEPVPDGETGEVVVTDLTGLKTPFIRYRTGDLAKPVARGCSCGWNSPSWLEIAGRSDDYLVTPEGRRVRIGGHIIRPASGVRESQITQVSPGRIIIRVVPDLDFDKGSMLQVLEAAHRYLGESVRVSWEEVDRLPRAKSGKLRHIVREF